MRPAIAETATSRRSRVAMISAAPLFFVLAMLLACCAAPCALARDTDYLENVSGFPGWRGELPQKGGSGGGNGGGKGSSSMASSSSSSTSASSTAASKVSSSSSSSKKKPVPYSGGSSSGSSKKSSPDFNSPEAVSARQAAAKRALAAAEAAARVREASLRRQRPDAALDAWSGEKRLLSWAPRAFLLKDFLTPDECDYLIEKARPQLEVSTVVDAKTGVSLPSKVRTSSGTFFDVGADAVVDSVERRIGLVTGLPIDHGEGLQVLRYVDGQNYQPHDDFFSDEFNVLEENGGQRVATVLMYLTTPEEGGETVFPSASRKVSGPQWSECAREGFAVKPKRGDALLFYSLKPNGKKDEDSLHGSCPVLKGEKWSSTKWIHVVPFGAPGSEAVKQKWNPKGSQKSSADGDGGSATAPCRDLQADCPGWAQLGECSKNPRYMLSSCRKSCGACGSSSGGGGGGSGGSRAATTAKTTTAAGFGGDDDADDSMGRLRAAAALTAQQAKAAAAGSTTREAAI